MKERGIITYHAKPQNSLLKDLTNPEGAVAAVFYMREYPFGLLPDLRIIDLTNGEMFFDVEEFAKEMACRLRDGGGYLPAHAKEPMERVQDSDKWNEELAELVEKANMIENNIETITAGLSALSFTRRAMVNAHEVTTQPVQTDHVLFDTLRRERIAEDVRALLHDEAEDMFWGEDGIKEKEIVNAVVDTYINEHDLGNTEYFTTLLDLINNDLTYKDFLEKEGEER